jgi:carboxypeptidase Taq
MSSPQAWSDLTTILRDLEAIDGAAGVLGWDQQTMMPRRGGAARGEQMAVLARLGHERLADPKVGELLDALGKSELDAVQKAAVRNTRRHYARATRVSPALVTKLAVAQSDAFEAWVQAKQRSDFESFAPHLEKLLELTLERARAIDPSRHPYDVLLDEFDPGTTVASLRGMFARLRSGLSELIRAVATRPQLPYVDARFPVDRQRGLHSDVARALGYDFEAGRLDEAEHPFTVGLHPHDVRITTHFYEDDILGGLGGTVHETGHALYEQGLPLDWRGTNVCRAASFGLHESQSRFWENFVGRSLPFFRWFEGRMKQVFPETAVTAEDLYRAANRVVPGTIRVKADEVTYNLHIIVRFEIELELFEGRLAVRDLPAAWNRRYQEYLGITPPNDAEGVLQDVHWSSGAFAYFPSYTLGNLYAASFGATLQREIPDLWSRIEQGDFAVVLGWLREKIHRQGHLNDAPDIVRGVVGDRDHVEDLLAYLWARHGALYGVTRP